MYIIYLTYNSASDDKHSAWNTQAEAAEQLRVLKNNGYNGFIIYDKTVKAKNGHYYI